MGHQIEIYPTYVGGVLLLSGLEVLNSYLTFWTLTVNFNAY